MSSPGSGVVNGGISYWYADDGLPATVREPLAGDTSADVVIVGGGYTGLWTAYYLKKAAPFLRITVLEQRFCGYGASGRNGGWLYNGVAGRDRYASLHGHEAAVRLQRAMNDTVDEVIRVAAAEDIDADIHRVGVLEVACTPAQAARLKAFPRRSWPSARRTGSCTGRGRRPSGSGWPARSAPPGRRTAPACTR